MKECILASVVNGKGYSVDWRDIVRPNALRRFKYKCSDCGVSNRLSFTYDGNKRIILDDDWLLKLYISKGFKISKIALSVSHECHTPACINEDHLKPRCQKCHLVFDKHIHLLRRLQGVRKPIKHHE